MPESHDPLPQEDDAPGPAGGPGFASFDAVNPVEEVNPAGAAPFVLLCDHASNALPARYGTLGLSPEALTRHIAWDIGAGAVTRELAALLDAPAVLAGFSRLLIDPNRGADDPTLVMKLSDGAIIPGNRHADAAEIAHRLRCYWQPYHDAVAARIDAKLAAGPPPAIVSIHSFTPVWRGRARVWHAGILWDRDPRLALPLIARLRAEPGLVVGDNEPYSGQLKNDTMYRHGTRRGLPHALIEIRQDLIDTCAGARDWAQLLAGVLRECAGAPGFHAVRHYGSHTDGEGPAADAPAASAPSPAPVGEADAQGAVADGQEARVRP